MNKKKFTWKLFIIGAILLIFAGASIYFYTTIPEDCDSDTGSMLYLSTISNADMSPDRTRIALNDNYTRMLVVDMNTGELLFVIDSTEISEGYAEINYEYFDEENNLYIYVSDWDESGDGYVAKKLLKYDADGNYSDTYYVDQYGYETYEEEQESLTVFEDIFQYVQFNNENITIYSHDMETGEITELGGFEYNVDNPIIWMTYDKNTSKYYVTYLNMEFGTYDLDGNYTLLGKTDFSFNRDDTTNIMTDQVTCVNGKICVVDRSQNNVVYTYEDGNWNQLVTLDNLLNLDFSGLSEEEADNLLYDTMIYPIREEEGNLGLCVFQNYFLIDMDGNILASIDTTEGYPLPKEARNNYLLRRITLICAIVFGLFGIVLLIGSCMKWHFSTLSKMVFITVPVVCVAYGFVIHSATAQLEETYTDKMKDELFAIASIVSNSIDGELVAGLDSAEDVDNGNVKKFTDDMEDLLNESTGWTDEGIYIDVFRLNRETGINWYLFSTIDHEAYLMNTYYRTYDEFLEKATEILDDDYILTSSESYGQLYLEMVKMIPNADGEDVGFICISTYLDKMDEQIWEMQKDYLVKMLILLAVLVLLMIIISAYITRNLRMASATIYKISEGDFSSRVEKIHNDELGAIGLGINHMAEQIETMFKENNEFSTQVVETLVSTIDAKDKYTNGHSVRVAEYSREIARRLGKSEEDLHQIYYAGLLHDIGKIGVPDEIINKPSRLTDEEYGMIKKHPSIGYEILKKLPRLENITVGAYGHHERIDGKGYPQGLKGEEIPEIARIIGVADVYDAMTSNRSYRRGLDQQKVRNELEKSKGTQLDAQFVDIMLAIDLEAHPNGYETN